MTEIPGSGDKSASKKGTIISAISGVALIVASVAQISGNLKPVWEFLGVSNSKAPVEAGVAAGEGDSTDAEAAEEEAAAEEIKTAEATAEKKLADLEPDYSTIDAVERRIAVNNPCNRTMQVKLIYEMPDGQIYIPADPTDLQEFPAGDKFLHEGFDNLDSKTKRGFVLVRATTKDGVAHMAGDYAFTIGGQTESYEEAKLEVDDGDDYYFDLTCPS